MRGTHATIDLADATSSLPDKITEGLEILGIRTWEEFLDLDGIHLQTLQKNANHMLVDALPVAKDKIILLHNLILDADANGTPDWDNPN